jgi:O-antigen/teichoic acid export membrane protein
MTTQDVPTRPASPGRLHPLYATGFALTASSLAAAGLGYLYWIWLARHADQATVGTASALTSSLIAISTVAQLSLGGFITAFLPLAARKARRLVLGAYGAATGTSLLLGAGFVLLAPHLSDSLRGLGSPLTGAAFIAAVAVWSIFALQDSVLTGLRRAVWVPVESTAFGVGKIVVLGLAGPVTIGTVLFSWAAPAAVLILPISWLIFARLLPRHARSGVGSDDLGGWPGYLARDTAGLLLSQAATNLMPLLVLVVLGGTAAGVFGVSWVFVQTFDQVSYNMGMSLTAEGARSRADLAAMHQTLRRRLLLLMAAAAAVGSLLAPLLLRIMGAGYAATGVTCLVLLLVGSAVRSVNVLAVCAARAAKDGWEVFRLEALAALLVPFGAWLLGREFGLTGVGVGYLVSQTALSAFAMRARVARITLPTREKESPSRGASG